MWVDINAYIGNWPYKKLKNNNLQGLLERMNQFGVNQSVVANLNSLFYKNTQAGNEELFEEIKTSKKYKNRIIPFSIINPVYPGWKQDFVKSVDMGAKGIRIYPQYHDYSPDDKVCVELVQMAGEAGIPVGLTVRMVDSRQRSWLDIDHVAGTEKGEWSLRNFMPLLKAATKTRFLFLNISSGLAVNPEDVRLLRNDNVLFDTSGRSLHHMPSLLKEFGSEKFAFGSHSPILDYLTGMLRIESMTDQEANETVKNKLRYQNARRFIDIT